MPTLKSFRTAARRIGIEKARRNRCASAKASGIQPFAGNGYRRSDFLNSFLRGLPNLSTYEINGRFFGKRGGFSRRQHHSRLDFDYAGRQNRGHYHGNRYRIYTDNSETYDIIPGKPNKTQGPYSTGKIEISDKEIPFIRN